MPELPEVENVRLSLEGLGAKGQRFQAVDLRAPKLRTPLSRTLKAKLPGESIIRLTRRAKFLLFETEKFVLLSHLGMTGSWRPRKGEELIKHDHVVLGFQSGLELVYNDPRRFGVLELIEKSKLGRNVWLKNLGPEPFDSSFTAEYLFESTRGLSAPIKNVIMDQKRVVGVGNIYASEALFLAQIKPSRQAGKVSRAEAQDLVGTIQSVLKKAIAAGGSTIRDYRNSNGERGQFQDQFVVYDRKGEPCVACSTPLKSKFIGQRNTYWCPQCQR